VSQPKPGAAKPPVASPGPPPIRELRGPNFRLTLPAGWSDRSLYSASLQTPEGLQATITVVTRLLPQGGDLAAYAEDQARQLAGQLPDFEAIKSERRMLGTRACQCVQFRWKPDGSDPVRQSQWYVQNLNLVYTITATVPEAASRDIETRLANIIGAFVPVE
jgi:hypothetical protein